MTSKTYGSVMMMITEILTPNTVTIRPTLQYSPYHCLVKVVRMEVSHTVTCVDLSQITQALM